MPRQLPVRTIRTASGRSVRVVRVASGTAAPSVDVVMGLPSRRELAEIVSRQIDRLERAAPNLRRADGLTFDREAIVLDLKVVAKALRAD